MVPKVQKLILPVKEEGVFIVDQRDEEAFYVHSSKDCSSNSIAELAKYFQKRLRTVHFEDLTTVIKEAKREVHPNPFFSVIADKT